MDANGIPIFGAFFAWSDETHCQNSINTDLERN